MSSPPAEPSALSDEKTKEDSLENVSIPSLTKGDAVVEIEAPPANKDESLEVVFESEKVEPILKDRPLSKTPFDDEKEESDNEKIEMTMTDEGNFENEKPVKVDLQSDDEGDDSATLPLKKKPDQNGKQRKEKPPIYLFPLTRLKIAWARSSNIVDFLLRAIAIVFSTLGWFCCVGGVPLMSLAMLIVGCVYIDDCKIQPNIPIYLVVSGVFGTIQHIIAIWTKYIPKESQGRLKVYRAYCLMLDCTIHLFLAIWFVLGCIWVYGIYSEVDFKDDYKDEYCNKTVYLFAFWILNFSFILLSLLIVCSLCCILFIVISPKENALK